MKTSWLPICLLLIVACRPATAGDESAILEAVRLEPEAAARWKLPGKLGEISGLALTTDGRLLAHQDQHATVYELDPHGQRVVKAFSLGDPRVKDDFEGIAFAKGQVYLVTSAGLLYQAAEGEDGERVPYQLYDTGVAEICREVEGLAYEPGDDVLALACKSARYDSKVLIYRWSLASHAAAEPALIEIRGRKLREKKSAERFRPSGIEWQPESGHYVLVSSHARSIAEVTPAGKVVGLRTLPGDDHRQPEAVTLTGDGTIVIGDEAKGRRARLTLYPPKDERRRLER